MKRTSTPTVANTVSKQAATTGQTTYSPVRRVIRTVFDHVALEPVPFTLVPPSPFSDGSSASAPPSPSALSSTSSSARSKRGPSPVNDHQGEISGSSAKRARSGSPSDAGVSSAPGLVLPQSGYKFVDFRPQGVAFVDKTYILSALPERFKYILLRPTGLSAPFPADPRNTKPQSTPLHEPVLYPTDHYKAELGTSSTEALPEAAGDRLTEILKLVRQKGHTLFVSVDDFDAPFWSPLNGDDVSELESVQEITDTMKTHLWGPLRAAGDVVLKLLVAGCLLPQPTLLGELQLTSPLALARACGFSLREAFDLARRVLDSKGERPPPSVGQYIFIPGSPIEPVAPPHEIFSWIRHEAPQFKADVSLRLLSDFLDVLPEEALDHAQPTLEDLVSVVACGAIELDLASGACFLDGRGPRRPSWPALFYAGALTRDHHSQTTCWLSDSPVVLAVIHARVDELIERRYSLRYRIMEAMSLLCQGLPGSFLELVQSILQDQTRRCLGRPYEPNLRGVFELALRGDNPVGKLQLMPFIPSPYAEIPSILQVPCWLTPNESHAMELTTLSLVGLWRGDHPNLDDDDPSNQDLLELHEKIRIEDETRLLERQYRVWSASLQAMETSLVGTFVATTAPEHFQFVAVGGARVLFRGPIPPEPQPDYHDYDDEGYPVLPHVL
uniref:AAA-ATPase-like domain-containing protein n=1 Tax=Mycena chlorophos TaxID=658473 RepID=A0ABQ0LDZ9_MYCCL|nr:predicted protein [Mycena chlorophos]